MSTEPINPDTILVRTGELERLIDVAKMALVDAMLAYSQKWIGCDWNVGLEKYIWKRMGTPLDAEKEAPEDYLDLQKIRFISNATGGWAYWDDIRGEAVWVSQSIWNPPPTE